MNARVLTMHRQMNERVLTMHRHINERVLNMHPGYALTNEERYPTPGGPPGLCQMKRNIITNTIKKNRGRTPNSIKVIYRYMKK